MHLVELNWIDWVVIVAYFVISLAVGLYYSKRAGSSLVEYFISGRSLPWWVAGTSMVATTFAADTPLAVTGLVAKFGLAGNWFWWAMAVGGMLTVFVFSRLWRRAEVLTDVELIEMRYSGRPAAFLRGFRSIYLALPINCIIMGWVTSAMVKVLKVTVFAGSAAAASGDKDLLIIAACLIVVGIYSALSGLWGVAITDFIQFIMAMGGCILLAVLAVRRVGGMEALQSQVATNFGSGDQAFRFFPDFSQSGAWMPLQMFLIYLFVIWWASWYPGAEPGGGGYVVQRMASCKDERHSLLATLWFQVAHYCVRPWPWLLVAFAALVMHPELRTNWIKDPGYDPGIGFPMLMRDLLPAGLRGLLLVAFFAAFMSTLATQINWGASYLVSDFYKRFVRPDASEKQLGKMSRWATVLMLVCGGATALWMVKANVSVDAAWKFLAALGAGAGAVFILRWFWWRINAWSEIAAMVASLVYFVFFKVLGFVLVKIGGPKALPAVLATDEYLLALVAALTVPTWLVVTFVTRPEPMETLKQFFRKTRPGGPGWGPVARQPPDAKGDQNLGLSIACALLGIALVYFTLPGLGYLLFGQYGKAIACLCGSVICGAGIVFLLNRSWKEIAR